MTLYQILSENARKSPGFTIGLGFFLYLIGAYFVTPLLGLSLRTMMDLSDAQSTQFFSGDFSVHPLARTALLLIQSTHQILAYGVSSLIVLQMAGYSQRDRGLKSPKPINILLWGSMIMLGSIFWGQFLNFDPNHTYLPESMQEMEQSFQEVELRNRDFMAGIMHFENPVNIIWAILVMAVVPAFCEEFFFRSMVQQELMKQMGPILAITVSAMIFSFMHLQFHGFLGRLALGFILGWMFWKTGNLWTSILGHFVFNAVSIIGGYLSLRSNNWEWPEGSQLSLPWYGVLIALLVSVGAAYILHIQATRNIVHEE
ncbi:MAG: CPBP family intramembrane glutamic endopeptidase [Bacteroidota bacterium]